MTRLLSRERVVLALSILCFWIGLREVFSGARVFRNDAEYWVALYTYFGESLRNGTLALWNPYMNGGEPFYHLWGFWRLLDPLNLVLLAVGLFLKSPLFDWYHIQHLIKIPVFALGAYSLWKETLGGRAGARVSLVVTFLFFLNALFTAFYIDGYLDTLCWMPYIFLCLIRFLTTQSRRAFLLGVYLLGVLIGGSTYQFLFPVFVLLLFLAIEMGISRGKAWGTFRAIPRGVWYGAVLMLIALSAPMVMTGLKHLETFPIARFWSERSLFDSGGSVLRRTYAQSMVEGVHWSPTEIFSLLFGYPIVHGSVLDMQVLSAGWRRFAYPFSIFLVPFAIIGVLFGKDRWRGHFGALFLASFFCVAGPSTPVHRLMCWVFPPLIAVRNTMLCFPYLLLSYSYFFILGVVTVREREKGTRVVSIVGSLLGLLLVAASLRGDLFRYYTVDARDFHRTFPKTYAPFETIGPRKLATSRSCYYLLDAVNHRQNVALTMLAAAFAPLPTDQMPLYQSWDKIVQEEADPERCAPVYGLRGFTWTRHYHHIYQLAEERVELFAELMGVGRPIFELKAGALKMSDDQADEFFRATDTPSVKTFLQSHVILASGSSTQEKPGEFSYQVTSYLPSDLSLETKSRGGGYLLFWDGYDPDWRAYVNGQRVKVERANLGFKAVRLPPGKNDVRFAYWPSGWLAALVLYLTAVVSGPIWIFDWVSAFRSLPSFDSPAIGTVADQPIR